MIVPAAQHVIAFAAEEDVVAAAAAHLVIAGQAIAGQRAIGGEQQIGAAGTAPHREAVGEILLGEAGRAVEIEIDVHLRELAVIVHVDPHLDAVVRGIALPRDVGEAVADQLGGELHAGGAAAGHEGEGDLGRVERDRAVRRIIGGIGRQIDPVAAGDARTLEIGDDVDRRGRRIGTRPIEGEGEDVVARAAGQRIAVQPADERVVAAAAAQRVDPRTAADIVRRAAADQRVAAGTRLDPHRIGGERPVEMEQVGLELRGCVHPGDVGGGGDLQPDLPGADLEPLDIGDGGGREGDEAGIDARDRQRVDLILARSAVDPVRRAEIGADRDQIGTGAGIDDVVAAAGGDLVVAGAAGQRVVAGAAVDDVRFGAAVDIVLALAAGQDVAAGAAGDRVVAAGAVERVVPLVADDRVRIARAGVGVVQLAAREVRHVENPLTRQQPPPARTERHWQGAGGLSSPKRGRRGKKVAPDQWASERAGARPQGAKTLGRAGAAAGGAAGRTVAAPAIGTGASAAITGSPAAR